MTPLGAVVGGLVLVFVDLRFDGLDVVPDVLGWLAVLVGLVRLAGSHPGFAVAAAASALGFLQSWGQVAVEPGELLRGLETVAQTVLVFAVCTGLRGVVPDERTRVTADRIRWIDLGLTLLVVLALAVLSLGTYDGAATSLLVLVIVLAIGVYLWFLVLLWGNRERPELGGRATFPVQ
jgi:hypothetical protein